MSFSKERISYLLQVWSSKKATSSEEQELMEIISQKEGKDAFHDHIDQIINDWNGSELLPATDWENAFQQIMQKRQPDESKQPKVAMFTWLKWSAAAVILLLVASTVYVKLRQADGHHSIVRNDNQASKNGIAPPSRNKAILTLGNGKVVLLDDVRTGSLASEGVANASKLNEAELAYDADGVATPELHTLTVPNGSKPMQLKLADGSEVWLNAGSRITFPNIFTGENRKVSIEGEVYFEVTKDAHKSFIVEANGTRTEVLGTRFNVNAYDNEPGVKITLLDGAVRVNKERKSVLLKPGQQAESSNGKDQLTVQDADTEQVMAWMHGAFLFRNSDIQDIMRQTARWYNAEIVYKGDLSVIKFSGGITRQENIRQLLDILEADGRLKFTINGNTITVALNK